MSHPAASPCPDHCLDPAPVTVSAPDPVPVFGSGPILVPAPVPAHTLADADSPITRAPAPAPALALSCVPACDPALAPNNACALTSSINDDNNVIPIQGCSYGIMHKYNQADTKGRTFFFFSRLPNHHSVLANINQFSKLPIYHN